MDYDAFLAILATTRDFAWGFLDPKIHAIRGRLGPFSLCPITAVAVRVNNRQFRTRQVEDAARRIGLLPELWLPLMNAADCWTGHSEPIRRDLLNAVGLEEFSQ